MEDENGILVHVTNNIRRIWDKLWTSQNEKLSWECRENLAFHVLKDKMFSLFSWMGLSKEFPLDIKYH